MRALRTPLSTRLHRKVCLSCGYDGNAIQGHRAESTYACPNCGEDLYARPPRSYAELEGLEDEDLPEYVLLDRDPEARPRTIWGRLISLLRRSLAGRR